MELEVQHDLTDLNWNILHEALHLINLATHQLDAKLHFQIINLSEAMAHFLGHRESHAQRMHSFLIPVCTLSVIGCEHLSPAKSAK